MGQDTWNRLFPPSSSASVNPPATAADYSEINPQLAPANFPILKRGMRGETVRDLQERLRAEGIFAIECGWRFSPGNANCCQGGSAAISITSRRYSRGHNLGSFVAIAINESVIFKSEPDSIAKKLAKLIHSQS